MPLDSSLSRRKVIASTGIVGLGGVSGLAGCMGSPDDGTTPTQTRAGTLSSSSVSDFSDTSLTYWSVFHNQSGNARSTIQTLVDSFESQTGATMQPNFAPFGNTFGAKWLNSFQNGEYPVVLDHLNYLDSKYAEWIKPFSEYRDRIDSDILSAVEWVLPALEHCNRGPANGEILGLPIGVYPQNPIVVRADHLEAAGLDPDSDFPPTNYEELLDMAQTLQSDGPAQFGYQIFGSPLDLLPDVPAQWSVAAGGEDGLILNEDMTDTNLDNDIWIESFSNYVETYTEHELGSPQSPTITDEETIPLMVGEQVSLSNPEFPNIPTIKNQAPSLYEDGTFRWGPGWAGNANERGIMLGHTICVTNPPEGADTQTWERKQEAAIEFINMYLSREFQSNLWDNFGVFPVRDDVWSELPSGPHNAMSSATTMLENSSYFLPNHPKFAQIVLGGATQEPTQEAIRGNISPEEAMQQSAENIRNIL